MTEPVAAEKPTSTVFSIRTHFDDTDLPQLRRLYDSAFPIQYGDSFYEALATGVYNGRPLVSVVAVGPDGLIIGGASASYDSSGRQLVMANRQAVYVLTLAVSPAFKRLGVGTALMKAVDVWARAQPNVDAIFLHVLVTNANAIRFYEQLGFANFKLEVGFYPIQGQLEDAFLLVKYFEDALQPEHEPEEQESLLEKLMTFLGDEFSRLFLGDEG